MNININSKIERENDKKTSVFVKNYNDESIIKKITLKLNDINKDEALNKDIYAVVEDYRAYKNRDELIEKEARRSIGYTNKIRIFFAVKKASEGTLIITVDNTKVSYSQIVDLYKYIMGENNTFKKEELTSNGVYDSSSSLSFGVPEWNIQQIFTKCNSIEINEDSLDKSSKSGVITALMAALNKYKSTSAKILIKENAYKAEKVKVAFTDENQIIKFIEEDEFNKDAVEAYESGIVFSDMIDSECDYEPFLAAVYPITLFVSEDKGVIKKIKIAASEKVVNEVVLKQFTKLFMRYLTELNKNDSHTIQSLNALKVNFEIYEEFENIDENIQENYENYNIVEVINDNAKKYADRIAISYEDTEIKYSQLSEKSDILAKKLIARGVKSGEKIVVSLPQDEKLIILIQAIIKAGAVYIPVDPAYPMERISFIVEDSEAGYIISDLDEDKLYEDVKKISFVELYSNDDDESIKDIELDENPRENGYVIYTSGTTGKPKGVSVPSKNIVALINATKDEFDLNETDVWTMFHSYSFDFSVWEMWGCLLTGGKLVVVPRETSKSHYDLHELLKEKKVTVLNQTPASFYALEKVDSENRGAQLTSIRLVIFGGEALDTSKLDTWFKRYPTTKCRVVNMYGITETTIHVTHRDVNAREQEYLAKSVGKALNGWEISIRNKAGELCLVGMEGEMWISGVGVANGYLNRDKLNKEKFVVDANNKKWYRSGDLGRFRADGTVDYLGRIDNQVKIRGFRIELDEIKNVLLKVPYVEDAVVSVFSTDENDAAKKQMYGFIKVNEDHSEEETKKYLADKLPVYMIPTKIVSVDEIPMTINGKVDYKLLLANSNNSKVQTKVKNQTESDLCVEIWSQVLGSQVSEDDEFFKSGGNSLLAVELASELKKRVDSTLKLKDVYMNSTPRKMKMFLQKKKDGGR